MGLARRCDHHYRDRRTHHPTVLRSEPRAKDGWMNSIYKSAGRVLPSARVKTGRNHLSLSIDRFKRVHCFWNGTNTGQTEVWRAGISNVLRAAGAALCGRQVKKARFEACAI